MSSTVEKNTIDIGKRKSVFIGCLWAFLIRLIDFRSHLFFIELSRALRNYVVKPEFIEENTNSVVNYIVNDKADLVIKCSVRPISRMMIYNENTPPLRSQFCRNKIHELSFMEAKCSYYRDTSKVRWFGNQMTHYTY